MQMESKKFTGEFTQEEYQQILREIRLDGPNDVRFDTLAQVTERLVRPTVRMWCRLDGRLQEHYCEDELMQRIHLRLIRTVVTGYLYPKRHKDELRRDEVGFRLWMFSQAEREKKTYLKNLAIEHRRVLLWDDVFPFGEEPTEMDGEGCEEQRACLKAAFSVVLAQRVRPYKLLCWMAVFLCIARNRTKIEANGIVERTFSHRSLFEMCETVFDTAQRLGWLEVGDGDRERFRLSLCKEDGDGRCFGEKRLEEFYMKQGAKKSLSDWFHRINEIIKRSLEDGTSLYGADH